MTTLDWLCFGITACFIWLLTALSESMVLALSSGPVRGRARGSLRIGGDAAIGLAFVVSAVTSALFRFHLLLLPIDASVFAASVTSGIGLGYAAGFLTSAIAKIVRRFAGQ